MTRLRALSIRQPWAWLVVNGYKDVENRSWRTRYRGPLLIHAGANRTGVAEDMARVEKQHGIQLPAEFDYGGIVGVVELVDCRACTGSPWHERGAVGWVVSRPRRLPFHPVKGALGLFTPQGLGGGRAIPPRPRAARR